MIDLRKIRTEILKNLNNKEIPFVMIGAQAVAVWGSSRESFDIDFAVRIVDADAIIDLMYDYGYRIPTASGDEARAAIWAKTPASAKQFAKQKKLGALNFYLIGEHDEREEIMDQFDFVFENPVPFPSLLRAARQFCREPLILAASIDHLIIMKKKCVENGRDEERDKDDLRFLLKKREEMKGYG